MHSVTDRKLNPMDPLSVVVVVRDDVQLVLGTVRRGVGGPRGLSIQRGW
jgi:hypothetical protein